MKIKTYYIAIYCMLFTLHLKPAASSGIGSMISYSSGASSSSSSSSMRDDASQVSPLYKARIEGHQTLHSFCVDAFMQNPAWLEGYEHVLETAPITPENDCRKRAIKETTLTLIEKKLFEQIPPRTLTGGQKVWLVAYSPDGSQLASVLSKTMNDSTMSIWDTHTGEILHRLTGHKGLVRAVAFSPDGSLIASVLSKTMNDSTISMWDTHTGEILHRLTGHKGLVRAVAFSPDGLKLASGSDSTSMWDTHTGECLYMLGEQSENWVSSVAFSPDGLLIVSAFRDGTISIWDTRTRKLLNMLGEQWEGGFAPFVAFSPDGSQFASGGPGWPISVWHAQTGQLLYNIWEITRKGVLSIAYSPDGSQLAASALYDTSISAWHTRTGKLLYRLSGHGRHVNSVAYSPDGSQLASGSSDKTIKLWTLTYKAALAQFSPEQLKKLFALLKAGEKECDVDYSDLLAAIPDLKRHSLFGAVKTESA